MMLLNEPPPAFALLSDGMRTPSLMASRVMPMSLALRCAAVVVTDPVVPPRAPPPVVPEVPPVVPGPEGPALEAGAAGRAGGAAPVVPGRWVRPVAPAHG